MKRVIRGVILSVIGLIGACLLSTVILALSNRSLPTRSQVTETLSEESKAHLAKVIRLRQNLGSEVWPGWGEVDVPIIFYKGETRFYYTGMAQAILLDRLLPNWKERVFDPNVSFEDLLREAVWPESTARNQYANGCVSNKLSS